MVKNTASKYLQGLNQQQKAAVSHEDGPAMVIAGAGTGKTRVITTRIAYLIAKNLALPEEILALTFTDKAAVEMETRVDQLLPYGYVNTRIKTFHALGFEILQEHGFEIGLPPRLMVVSVLQQHILLQETLELLDDIQYFRPSHNPQQYRSALLSLFSRLKDDGLDPKTYKAKLDEAKKSDESILDSEGWDKYFEAAKIYEVFQNNMVDKGLIDYGDQLLYVYQLLQKKQHIRKYYQQQFKYILVDEYQDTNSLQAKILHLITSEKQNIMVVGDDDQSIYRFRGAELENMLNFTELYANTKYYSLTNNYRSTQHIVDLAYTLIQHNNPARLEIKTGLSKRLKAQIRGTLPEVQQYADNQEEFQALAKNIQRSAARGDSVAVLCRNNGHVDELIQYLQHLGIPVASQANKNLLHAPVVRQCIDFVRVLHDPDDSAALYRYLVSPKLKVPTTNVMTLAALARKNRVCLKEVIEDNRLTAQKESNALLALDGYRKIAHDHTIGEVLYRFVTDDDYLDGLARKAQDDNQAAHSVRQLAAFFNLVKEFEAVEKHRDSLHFWSYLQDMYSTDILEEIDLIEESEGVHVMTAHRAKGLEFDVVYLYDMTEGNFPAIKRAEQLKSPKDFNLTTKDIDLLHESEERRLMYVAMTRAKKHLVMTLSLDHGGKKIRKLSRFLLEAFDKNLKIDGYLEKSGLPAAIMRHRPTMSQPGEKPTFPIDSDGFMVMSPSQVANYLYNPSSFFVQHVLGFPNPPSHQAVYGVSIHASLEYFYRQKLAGRTPKLKEMLNIFNDTWRSEGFISLRHEQERRREGESSIANYYSTHINDGEEIVAVEQEFNFQIDELKLRLYGRYDLVVKNTDSKISIRDFKTSYVSDPKTAQNKVRDNIALGIYALAWDRENDEKVSTIELYFTEARLLASRDKIEHQKTMDKLSKVVEGIKSGHFPHKGNQTNLEEEGLV